jgi:hypothetical protein
MSLFVYNIYQPIHGQRIINIKMCTRQKINDYERFRQQVSDTDWDTIINDDDTTNNVCINFTDKFLTIAKESIPLKTIRVCNAIQYV